jgi:acyl transferase domain-containing protein
VKGNFGHLLAAAGVAGLIKAVLAVEKNLVPPTVNYDTPNPGVDLANSPFFINREAVTFPDRGGPRRAGVSSFGIGGTNAHVVIEQAPKPAPAERSGRPELLVLSARKETALSSQVYRVAEHLAEHPEIGMGDVSYTLQVGRRAFPYRFYSVVDDAATASEALREPDSGTSGTARVDGEPPEVLFLFPGQGALAGGQQGQGYYQHAATYRAMVDECMTACSGKTPVEADLLNGFVTSYALAQTWMAWGVRPRALVGQGLGELVAACVSGVLQPRDALRYLVRLAELLPETPEGRMPRFDGIGDGLWEVCAEMHFGRPRIPWFSSVSGRLIDLNTASDPTYWSRLPQGRDGFDDAVAAALAGGINLVLESGAESDLGNRVLRLAGREGISLVHALPDKAHGPRAEWVHALCSLGRCWLAGCDIEWEALHPGARHRVCLPTYPFERVSHCLPTLPAVERPSPVSEV